MSALPKMPVEDATVAAARACADLLLAQGFTPEQCAILAFVKGASYGIGVAASEPAQLRALVNGDVPGWPAI